MLLFCRLRFRRKYKEEMHFRKWKSLEEFVAIYSDVLGSMTNYKSSKQILQLSAIAGFRSDFSYTTKFFSTKLLSMMRRTPNGYGSPTSLDRAALPILKRLASVALHFAAAHLKTSYLELWLACGNVRDLVTSRLWRKREL